MSQQRIRPLGARPCRVICPNCQRQVLTKTERKTPTKTKILALLLWLFGCWIFASMLYFTNCARNVEHTCPACGASIGTYEP